MQTRLFFVALVSFVVVIWVGLLLGVLYRPGVTHDWRRRPPPGASLLMVLAPVVAAATGVERLLESVFNTLENVWRTGVAYLGYGMRWLKLAETRVADARMWMQNIAWLLRTWKPSTRMN
jgi:threonine/homoserine/homoserine lactone efflux protein